MSPAIRHSRIPGTVNFVYDDEDDLVFARPRFMLELPGDVMRWYELYASYFSGRFSKPKDVVTVVDELEVSPDVGDLWNRYVDHLHETVIRYSANVATRARWRFMGGRPVPTVESLADAVASILARRKVGASGTVRVVR